MSASTGCGHAVAFHIRRGTPKLVVQIKTIAAGLRVCIENLIRFDCAQSQQNLAFFCPPHPNDGAGPVRFGAGGASGPILQFYSLVCAAPCGAMPLG
jgi:hypothetical protein